MTEASCASDAAGHLRRENDARDVFQRSENKKSSRPRQTLRIAPASSSSPVPQPSRERWSIFRAGLLAHGSSYSPCLPIRQTGQWRGRVSSPFTAAGPRGICTLFPYPEIINVRWHSRRRGQFLSSSLMCRHSCQAAMAAQRPLTTVGNITTFYCPQRHGVCLIVCKG